MNKRNVVYFSIFIILITSAIGNVNAINASVSGSLKDGSGNSIVAIMEFVHGQTVYNSTTSHSGTFSYNPPINWYVWKLASINKTGNMPRFFEVEKNITLASAVNQNLVPVIFTQSGQVTDSNGIKLIGATIDTGICNISLGGFHGTEQDIVTTDSNGVYLIHFLPSSCNNLKITTSGGLTFLPNSGRNITINNNSTVNYQLATPISVNGTIKDSNSNPISATVELVADNFVERTFTDNSGDYQITIPVDNYTLKFSQNNLSGSLPRFFDIEKPVNIKTNSTFNLNETVLSVSGVSNQTNVTIDVKNPLSNNGYTGFSSDRVSTNATGYFSAKLLQSSINTITVMNDNNGFTIPCILSGVNITC